MVQAKIRHSPVHLAVATLIATKELSVSKLVISDNASTKIQALLTRILSLLLGSLTASISQFTTMDPTLSGVALLLEELDAIAMDKTV